jgi:uncharacterized protein YdeI (BOF family)
MTTLTARSISFVLTLVLGIVLAVPVQAQDGQMQDEPNPYLQEDDTWISISGTVGTVSPQAFTLDYGDGIITVEMDDWDADADAYKLAPGDKITVFGEIDDDFFEATTIEASSVYVEDLGTYFYASAADEEDSFITITTPIAVGGTVVQGIVTSVDDEEFTLNTGLQQLTVEVDEMLYNPLDDEGYQRIEVGDRVSVSGTIDDDLFEGRELVAETIVTLD